MSWSAGTSFDRPRSNSKLVQSPTRADSNISPTNNVDAENAVGSSSSSGRKRKRGSLVVSESGDVGGGDESLRAGSIDEGGEGSPALGKQRHQPGVKRACNDCRQQKLRCNVVAGPGDYYKACDRCIKHKLSCSIDNDFKRLGKRAQHEEMAKELDDCRARLAQYESLGIALPGDPRPGSGYNPSYGSSPTAGAPVAQMGGQAFLGPNEAAASRSLLDLSQGYRELPPTSYPSITPGASSKTLRNVVLSDEQLADLYGIYFSSFHNFLPVLNPQWTHAEYYNLHPLLHWTIIAVAARRYPAKPSLLVELQQPLEEMLWTTLSQVPQVYHVCKALALLCAWPLPSASTSQEPTMMLTGVMFQLAMQYGLHRPSHAQDFSRFRVDLREEDIADRLNTWATVNIVAQMVSTGQGQPPLSRWAWYTYGLHLDSMKPELHRLCQIEKFCDTVTRTLFTMQRDHIVEVDEAQRGLQIDMYARELNEMELTIMSTQASRKSQPHFQGLDPQLTSSSAIDVVYLKAAALHLRLTAFFDKPTAPNYLADLRNVYIAASSLLTHAIGLPPENFLFMPRYIEQMMLGAAVTLLKLLNSFYASHVDIPAGRTLFSKTVAALRELSVRSNDLPQRLAEVLAQLWQSSGATEQKLFNGDLGPTRTVPDESLQLRVRCRSSLSLLYDAIWRWRQQVGNEGRQNLDRAVEHPTAIASGTDTSRNTPQPPLGSLGPNGMGLVGGGGPAAPSTGLGAGLGLDGDLDMSWDAFGGNAVFDPLSWALDGNLQFGGLGFTGTETLPSFQV
ncbi:hypothetical protein LTR78_003369 [Recurvomyces mirabilis]|uniref:Zn(2)-C6 fungal-type domain-containing protein n=1 Tax=Recurvomyces mirabilis TaxID=574656 RepID=A0AAE1C3J1_9PEZI|nr:hypothetical protein LTR78_003369 [Recurvomyces mirabilis]KAK5154595.1 hypothetical protein LTS14_006733 [Recurvomyces mirabilis]